MKEMYVWRDGEIECDEDDRVLDFESNQAIFHISILQGGKYVNSSDIEHVVRRWDGITGKLLKTFHAEHDWATFSANGESFFDKDESGQIVQRSLRDGAIERKFSGYGDLLFTSRSQPLGVSLRDESFVVWNYESGLIVNTIPVGEQGEYFLPRFALSPQGGYLLAKIQEFSVKLWHVHSASLMHSFSGEFCDSDMFAEPIISADGNHFIYSCYDSNDYGQLITRNIETGKVLCLERKPSDIDYSLDTALACSGNGKLLAVADNDRFIRIKAFSRVENLYCFLGHGHEISTLLFSNKGKFLYSAAVDGTITKWKMPFTEPPL